MVIVKKFHKFSVWKIWLSQYIFNYLSNFLPLGTKESMSNKIDLYKCISVAKLYFYELVERWKFATSNHFHFT